MKVKILSDLSTASSAVEEAKKEWLFSFLKQNGIVVPQHKDMPHITEFLLKNKVEIIDYVSLSILEIKIESDIVAKWNSPVYTLKQGDDGKKYYEITVDVWTRPSEEEYTKFY